VSASASLPAPSTPAGLALAAVLAASAPRAPSSAAKAEPAPLPSAAAPARSASLPLAEPPESVAGAYYVNVGLFAVPSNAQKAQEKLRGAGVKVQVHELQMKNGLRTRVRAGPYATRAQAQAAADAIRALGLDAVLFRQERAQSP
jgi:cell division septation protein DedD